MTMKNMTDVLDSLVRELKSHTELSHVRFIYAGKVTAAENPLNSFVAACEVKSFFANKVTGSVQGKLLFTLCAPKGAGKRELCELSVVTASFLDESDFKDRINSVACMAATFDEGASLWRQSIAVEVEFLDAPKLEGMEAEIEGVGTLLVEEFDEISKPLRYEIRELLSGVSKVETLKGEKILKVVTAEDLMLPETSFSLAIPLWGVLYEGCRLKKVQRNFLSKKTEFEICFEDKSVLREDE